MSTYNKHLSEPWFTLIKIGSKRCEGRLGKGDISNMQKGDYIIFENNDFGFIRKFKVKITSIKQYNNFKSYLENETLEKCLPGIDNINDGVNIYYKYYKPEDEIKYKIKALRIKVVKL